MSEYWLNLHDAPPQGLTYVLDDADTWESFLKGYGVPLRLADAPPSCEITARPQDKGVLVTGRLSGTVLAECDRCADQTALALDAPFEMFEELPTGDGSEEGPALVRERDGMLELDAAGVAWQQFAMSLPAKVLCDDACRGLCAHCGANLNTDPCGCTGEEADPRLAALRNLKIDN